MSYSRTACSSASVSPNIETAVELRRDAPRATVRRARPSTSCLSRRVLQRKHHLENGIATQIALGLELVDEFFRTAGPDARKRPVHRLLARSEQLREGGVAGELGPQDERVHEEADERLNFCAGPVGDRRANDFVLPVHRNAREARRRLPEAS